MKILIANNFSLSMLDRWIQAKRGDVVNEKQRVPRPCDDPIDFLILAERDGATVESVVGHADTAAVFSTALGRRVRVNRVKVKLERDALLLVGQYIGPRLQVGATAMPEKARIEWWTI